MSQYGNAIEARQLLSEEETAQNIFRNLIYMKADISEHQKQILHLIDNDDSIG